MADRGPPNQHVRANDEIEKSGGEQPDESLAHTVTDGLYQVDDEDRFVTVNDALLEATGYSRQALVGEHISQVFQLDVPHRSLCNTAHSTLVIEATATTADETQLPCRLQLTALADEGTVGVVSGLFDHQTEDCEDILGRIDDAFYSVDRDWRFTHANEMIADIAGMPAVDLLGKRFWDVFPATLGTKVERKHREAMNSGEPVAYEVYYEPSDAWVEVRAYPSSSGLSVYCRDITDERALEDTIEKNGETVQKLHTITADRERTFREKVSALLDLGCDYLGFDVGVLSGIDTDSGRFETLEVGGDSELAQPGSVVPLAETYCRRTIATDDLLGVCQASAEGWTDDPAYQRYEYDQYLGGTVTTDGELHGTLCFCAEEPREQPFSRAEKAFVELLVQWVSYELERRDHNQELEHQRNRLALLHRQNALVQAISHDLIEATSRPEIEQTVCDRLATSNQYTAAWISQLDSGQTSLSPTVCADSEKRLDCSAIDLESETPLTTAIQTALECHETTVATDCDPGCTATPTHCFTGLIAIVPLVFEGRTFGVLVVNSTDEASFDDHELATLDRLGDTIGHAMMSIERKAALTAERVTEIELRSEALAEPFLQATDDESGSIAVDRVVPLGDDETLIYQTVTGVDPDRYREAIGELAMVDDIRILDIGVTETRYEIRVTGPTFASIAMAYNGRIESMTMTATDVRTVVELPLTVDTREFVNHVRDLYPDVELLTKRTASRQRQPVSEFRTAVSDRLTDKQRLTLETSYFAGFFEWPRETTGEDLAETLGVAPATHHQHLREAERRLIEAFFESESQIQ